MDDLAALRLLAEWGADEALDEAPVDRFASRVPPRAETLQAGTSAEAAASPPGPAFTPARAPAPRPAATLADAPGQARQAADGIRSFEELHAALDAFAGCPLRATATSTVRPSGNPAAGTIVIAEAPGADDDRSGTAFAGPPGEMLDRVLASIGLDRTGVLLTHLVPWRPPGNRAPSDAEVAACLPFLHRLLLLAAPRRLVLLGAAPARVMTGATDGIRRLRGRWLQAGPAASFPGLAPPIPALPLLPMEQWMRSATTKRDLWSDLLQLRQSIDGTD